MSSEISTEPHGGDALRPWQLFTLAGLCGATVVVLISRNQTPAGVILLSLIIFAAAAVGLAALRTLVPLTGSDAVDAPQVLGGRTRTALEREKTLVLRTIKELEFDKAMGKVSEKDFGEMSARLRARAAGLIRQLDAGTGYREQIEREIQRRVGSAEPSAGRVARGGPAESSAGRVPRSGPAVCADCNTTNDPDARFCKNCGARLETAG